MKEIFKNKEKQSKMENLIRDMSNQNQRLKIQITDMKVKSELMQKQLSLQEKSINNKENTGSLISEKNSSKKHLFE
jgi:hypothetical protein